MTDDDDILAAEFALGLLDPAESNAVQSRARSDAVLSLRIAWWRDQLGPLVAEAEQAPPEHLWTKIASRLPVNDNLPRLMKRWRAMAIGATGIAAALAVYVGSRQPSPVSSTPVSTAPVSTAPVSTAPVSVASAPVPMVATLSGETNPAIVTVNYDATSGQMTVAPKSLAAGTGDAELWIIPEDGKPRSLGVIDAKAPAGHSVALEKRTFVHPGATFAITIERKGGSPTGLPEGSVIASAKIIRV